MSQKNFLYFFFSKLPLKPKSYGIYHLGASCDLKKINEWSTDMHMTRPSFKNDMHLPTKKN